MKKINRILVAVIWGMLIYIFFKFDLLKVDMGKLTDIFNSLGQYKIVLFIALSSLRVVAFIPSAVFMVFGGMAFGPVKGFFLTVLSITISETVVYIISKIMVGTWLQRYLISRHPKLNTLLSTNNKRILALGILCPIAPSDIICFLVSSMGLNYKKFITTVVVGNLPMTALYSFLGNSVLNSMTSVIITGAAVLLTSAYSIYLWNKEQKNMLLSGIVQ